MIEELGFTVTEAFDRKQLLAEVLEIISFADVTLGEKAKTKQADAQKEQIINLIKKLDEEQALFSPKLDVRHLTEKDFRERKIEPSLDLKAKMQDNYFYQVKIPITLFPKSGWAFTRLECWVSFCDNSADAKLSPIIYEIFPEDVWETILSFNDQLNIGLDENLTFRTEIEKLEGKWKNLGGEAQAKIALQFEGKANLVAGPFSYQIRRSKVRGRGRLNTEGFWRLDSNKHVDEEDILLGVVLMVPKENKQPVNAKGVLKAYHDFKAWSADFRDWGKDFRDVIKSLFNSGVVLQATGEWQDIAH